MYPFPEQHFPQALDVRRAQTLFVVGLTAILLSAIAIGVIAFDAGRSGPADAQVTTPGPAVYGWLPATQVQATDPNADLGIIEASRSGPAAYGWLPAPQVQATDADADLGIMDASEGH